MSKQEEVDFKWLDSKLQGNDTVVFTLEDSTVVKIKVDIDRAGVAVNFRNPDGTPHYNVNANLRIIVIPSEKKYTVPKANLQMQPQTPVKPTPRGQLA